MNSQKETARKSYIRLLAHAGKAPSTVAERDTVLLAELIEGNLLTGGVARGNVGQVVAAETTGITVEGRLFLQRLQQEERDDSLIRKSFKYAPVLVGYCAGLLSPLITDWIKTLIK